MIWAGSMATPAATDALAEQLLGDQPAERVADDDRLAAGSAAMIAAKWSVASSMPMLATARDGSRASATVAGSCGQPGATGS